MNMNVVFILESTQHSSTPETVTVRKIIVLNSVLLAISFD